MGLHGGQRLVGGHPAGSILQLLFFQSPNWKCLICCEKGLQGKKNTLWNMTFWEHALPLAPPKCVAWAKSAAVLVQKLPLSALPCKPVAFFGSKDWTGRVWRSGGQERAMAAGKQLRPGSARRQCPCGGRERAGSHGSGSICRCASPHRGAIWVPEATGGGAQLRQVAQELLVSVSPYLCFLQQCCLSRFSQPHPLQLRNDKPLATWLDREIPAPCSEQAEGNESIENQCPLSAVKLLLQEESHLRLLALMAPSSLAIHLLGSDPC